MFKELIFRWLMDYYFNIGNILQVNYKELESDKSILKFRPGFCSCFAEIMVLTKCHPFFSPLSFFFQTTVVCRIHRHLEDLRYVLR